MQIDQLEWLAWSNFLIYWGSTLSRLGYSVLWFGLVTNYKLLFSYKIILPPPSIIDPQFFFDLPHNCRGLFHQDWLQFVLLQIKSFPDESGSFCRDQDWQRTFSSIYWGQHAICHLRRLIFSFLQHLRWVWERCSEGDKLWAVVWNYFLEKELFLEHLVQFRCPWHWYPAHNPLILIVWHSKTGLIRMSSVAVRTLNAQMWSWQVVYYKLDSHDSKSRFL